MNQRGKTTTLWRSFYITLVFMLALVLSICLFACDSDESGDDEEADSKLLQGVAMYDASVVFDGEAHLPSIIGLTSDMQVSYARNYECVNAGEYEIECTILKVGYNPLELSCKLTIERADIDTSRLKFEDCSCVWDGTEKSIVLVGELPSGIEVEYSGNGKSEVGTYPVEAKLVGKNYNSATLTATLEILQKTYTVVFVQASGERTSFTVGHGEGIDSIPIPEPKPHQTARWSETNFACITRDMEVVAIYEYEKYQISYITNGGAISGDVQTVYTTAEEVELAPVARKGYAFCGWYASENFKGTPATKIALGSTGGKTFYAKWELLTFTVTYNLCGGTNDIRNINDLENMNYHYTVESSKLKLAPITREGYTFVGWVDEKGNPITEISGSIARDITLTAVWEKDVKTVAK